MNMNPGPDWRQLELLFSTACELSEDKREAFITENCTDGAMRQALESLLRADVKGQEFLEFPMRPPVLGLWREGTRFGPYRLGKEIGRGGMAIVYLAERADGEYRHEVAIKVIQPEMAGPDLLRRFRQERQILAQLDHPGIAQLLDGSTTDEGTPYFVLEYIPGKSIDKYCDDQRLDLRSRIELLLSVCSALSHAHRNLVVHRDLKPSNILVRDDGQPKLLDFGIAKLLHPVDPDVTWLEGGDSLPSLRIFTPRYASPEQILAKPISTSSDIYSLGMVLYLVLAGTLPRGSANSDERPEPWQIKKPSTTFLEVEVEEARSIAWARRTQPKRQARALTGDLDAICLNALRGNPEDRYASVDALAADLNNYLDGRPVNARRGRFRYHARKFILRHWAPLAAAAVALLCILASAAIAIRQAQEAKMQRDRSELERLKAEESSRFLVEVFQGADPSASAYDISAGEILDLATERLERSFVEQPALNSRLRLTLAEIYLHLGNLEPAENLARSALKERLERPQVENLELAEGWLGLATVQRAKQDLEGLRASILSALALLDPNQPSHRETLVEAHAFQAASLQLQGDLLGAEEEALFALNLLQPQDRDGLMLRARILELLGATRNKAGDPEGAFAYYSEALPVFTEHLGQENTETLAAKTDFAQTLANLGRHREAEAEHRRVLAIRKKRLGPEHPALANTLQLIAFEREAERDFESAETFHREALEIRLKALGPGHPSTLNSMHSVALAVQRSGDLKTAESLLSDVLDRARESLPPGHPLIAYPASSLGTLWVEMNQAQRAEPLLREALSLHLKSLPETHRKVARERLRLAQCLLDLGKIQEARLLTQTAVDSLVTRDAEDPVAVAARALQREIEAELARSSDR